MRKFISKHGADSAALRPRPTVFRLLSSALLMMWPSALIIIGF